MRPTLKLADKVIVLREGHVDACGTLDEVLKVSGEMCLIWRTDDPR
jgi:ABC-type molybdate transport system ATPase subunit